MYDRREVRPPLICHSIANEAARSRTGAAAVKSVCFDCRTYYAKVIGYPEYIDTFSHVQVY